VGVRVSEFGCGCGCEGEKFVLLIVFTGRFLTLEKILPVKNYIHIITLFFGLSGIAYSQGNFNYTVELQPYTIPGLPGIQSYAWAVHEGKWLIMGGRKDGLHARQPFNAFPQAQNNTDIYVIDIQSQQYWTASVNTLAVDLKEQLQATNMNFFQDADTLYFIGGYAYSPTVNDHITFDGLITISVSALIDDIITGSPIQGNFGIIHDSVFAVTGGRLGKIGDTLMLAGGHRFDGRYNAMGMPTYTQQYTNQVRKFTVSNAGNQPVIANYATQTDPVHLRRRDYNLLPYIFENGDYGYLISSGVFQQGIDQPFLYPVEIRESGYQPVPGFNQYLSHYHSAFASLYDSLTNEMHTLFFGGMSRYFYQNGVLTEDSLVPFTRTISRLSRDNAGVLTEYKLQPEMPVFHGASAEFIPNPELPYEHHDILRLDQITADTILIGHIFGGLYSPTLNPFTFNQTNTTTASSVIYAVKLIHGNANGSEKLDGCNPYTFRLYPNPASGKVHLVFGTVKPQEVQYCLTNAAGQILDQGKITGVKVGLNEYTIGLPFVRSPQSLMISLVFEGIYTLHKTFLTY